MLHQYDYLVSLNGDCNSDEYGGGEENVGGDKEGGKDDQVARHPQLHHDHQHHDCDHKQDHLQGTQGLNHVADDEEDVGDAEAAEQPVEEGSH